MFNMLHVQCIQMTERACMTDDIFKKYLLIKLLYIHSTIKYTYDIVIALLDSFTTIFYFLIN